jgi:DNA polymerase-1
MNERLLLIDGNNLLFRAYHGWAAGAPAEARARQTVIGFLALALRPVRQLAPTHVAVIFDADGPSFRHHADDAYKGNRKRPQEGEDHAEHHLPLVRTYLGRLGLCHCAEAGVEADDVIASAATEASVLGLPAVVYSSDRDFLQLVSEDVTVLPPERSRSIYTAAEVFNRFRVYPRQFVDFKALQGDPSDNLQGVPGIGPKTAAALLQQHDSVDNLYQRLWLAPTKLAGLLRAFEPRVRHNQAMIALRCDLPLPFSLDACRIGPDIAHLNPFDAVLHPEKSRANSAPDDEPAYLA